MSLSGVLLDRGGIFVASLVVLAMGLLFGIFGILRSYAAQLVAIGLLVFLRPLMYTFGESLVLGLAIAQTDHSCQSSGRLLRKVRPPPFFTHTYRANIKTGYLDILLLVRYMVSPTLSLGFSALFFALSISFSNLSYEAITHLPT